jgi:NADH-quinone oxidoreductase subunit G
MEGAQGVAPAPLIPFFWAPGWNSSMQSINKFQDEVNGPLRGGDPGRRLIEPVSDSRPAWPSVEVAPFTPDSGALLIVPFYHIFGSEELSVLSPGIRERSPVPYVALGPEVFSALGLAEDEPVEVESAFGQITLRARLEPTLARGLAGFPKGLPELPGPLPEGQCRIAKVKPS